MSPNYITGGLPTTVNFAEEITPTQIVANSIPETTQVNTAPSFKPEDFVTDAASNYIPRDLLDIVEDIPEDPETVVQMFSVDIRELLVPAILSGHDFSSSPIVRFEQSPRSLRSNPWD